MKVEIYIGTVWSGGSSSGEWYTFYVEIPNTVQDNEDAMMKYLSEWIDKEGIECVFWGIYNIPSQEDE